MVDGSIDISNRIPELNLQNLDDSSKFGRHNSSRVEKDLRLLKDDKSGIYYDNYDDDVD